MIRLAVSALALAAVLGGGAAQAQSRATPDFDQGIDARGALEDLRHQRYGPDDRWAHPNYNRTERDCAVISFRPNDPLVSQPYTLESRQYQERCYPSGPNGERYCHDEWVWTERRHVRVEVVGRGEMLPWEEDAFEVCLDGRWLYARVYDASHEYSLSERGDSFIARAGRKVPALPDPVGVINESFAFDGASGNFALTLRDRWASYYGGDQTVFKLKLKRHRENWFDETLVEKEVAFPAADSYKLAFAQWASEMNPKPENGKKYYVEWRFKRAGKVSKDKWQKAWESDKAVFGQAAQPSSFQAQAAAAREVCWFQRVERDQCLYRCSDGSTIRRPVQERDPWDNDGAVIACPQVVFPF